MDCERSPVVADGQDVRRRLWPRVKHSKTALQLWDGEEEPVWASVAASSPYYLMYAFSVMPTFSLEYPPIPACYFLQLFVL